MSILWLTPYRHVYFFPQNIEEQCGYTEAQQEHCPAFVVEGIKHGVHPKTCIHFDVNQPAIPNYCYS